MLYTRSIGRITRLLAISIILVSCLPDPSNQPEETTGFITTDRERVYFEGDLFQLDGTFYNPAGIIRVEVFNQKLEIDSDILLPDQPLTYELSMERPLPILSKPSLNEVEILVTDANNLVTRFTYVIDYVFRPEISDMNFLIDKDDGSKHYFNGHVEDPHGIKFVALHSLRIGQLLRIDYPKDVFISNLHEEFWYPDGETFGEYPLTLEIVNNRGFNLIVTDFSEVLGN